MTLKEFLENINVDEEWRVQYYSFDNADAVIVFNTGKDNSITEDELIKQYGDRLIEAIFIDVVKVYYKEYPQIVIEIKSE